MGEQRLLEQVLEEETEGCEGGAGEAVQRGELEGGVERLSREPVVEAEDELRVSARRRAHQRDVEGDILVEGDVHAVAVLSLIHI